ncbi:MAG: ABA4-like family protein [Lentilitoribacter sp.]
MSTETLFAISSPIAMLGWVALIISPIIPTWSDRIATYISPGLLSLAYMSLILAFWSDAKGGFDTLANVQLLFTQSEIAMAGWLHYLAFDLFMGAWIVREARKASISHWFIVPILPFTLLFGQIGYVLFLALKSALLLRRDQSLLSKSNQSTAA